VDGRAKGNAVSACDGGSTIACPVCLEDVPMQAEVCSECDEPLITRLPASSRPPSIPDMPPDAHWLRQHWRPAITLAAVGGLIGAGIALRHLAPERYRPPQRIHPPAGIAEPVCDAPCWHGEACQLGRCVWRPPNDVGHLPFQPTIAGPFELPSSVVDVLALDAERYAVSFLLGVQITNARTGNVLQLVSDAPLAQRLYRVGDTFYATAPRRIYVVDAKTTRVLKTIEIGSSVGDLAIGGAGRRVLASVPRAHAVAVIATDYHAEVARFFFGEDAVGPVAIDDTGQRAVATNGIVPIPGFKPGGHANVFGALYAFDASRLPSGQDRVRTGMMGNPADVLMLPDSKSSYVVLRERNEIVPIVHLPSGSVRQQKRLKTCSQPEQMALVRAKRRALVRCNAGHAIDVLDLTSHKRVRRIALNARASDMAITPDGKQAIIALPNDGDGTGSVGLLDLETYRLRLLRVSGEPHRIRLAPNGRSAVVMSDRSKRAWVIR